MYKIKTISNASEVNLGEAAEIAVYNWGDASGHPYRPYAQAKLCFIKDKGFIAELMCRESSPRAIYVEQNKNVCEDSCLEFFANFAPQIEASGYVNFEGNANGSLLCCYGRDISSRHTIAEMGIVHPKAEPFKTQSEWGYRVFIPLSLIKEIYGIDSYKSGDLIRGNFFKCGDKTEYPHFASYTVIDPLVITRPSFHQPAYFADMIIE